MRISVVEVPESGGGGVGLPADIPDLPTEPATSIDFIVKQRLKIDLRRMHNVRYIYIDCTSH